MVSSQRTYIETHPWISFECNFEMASRALWMRLGEIESKCEHISRVPLKPAFSQDLLKAYLTKGVQATTAIEGNTLSEEQVRRRVEGEQLELPVSQQYLEQEITNILVGFDHVVAQVRSGAGEALTVDDICTYNRMVLENLELEEHVRPGRVRSYSVGVLRYRGAPAEDCEYLLERLCSWLVEDLPGELYGSVTVAAAIKAALAHLYIAWIHPFGDGNGRTARLIETRILVGAGVPHPVSHLLSNHYNQTRSEYYRRLQETSERQNPWPFLEYAVQGFADQLSQTVERILSHQMTIAWHNYVFETFALEPNSPAIKRQRELVLSLPDGGVRKAEVANLTPDLARLYASTGPRTLSRDLNRIAKMNLITKSGDLLVPRKDLMLAFRPYAAP